MTGMRHWRVEINFEAWDIEDAGRMVDRMLKPVDAERRLLFATDPIETIEMRLEDGNEDDAA